MAEIIPIGGSHRSARSLLAQVMNDPGVARCVVITFGADGTCGWGHYDTTRQEMTYAAALINRIAFDEA